MNFREFRLSGALKEYMEQVLARDNVPYSVSLEPDEEGKYKIKVPLSARQFHIAVEDSMCELQRNRVRANRIPVYSFRTIKNAEKFARLRKLNGTNCFRILEKDRIRFLHAAGIE